MKIMPTLSRYFIKTAFFHLILGLSLSLLISVQPIFAYLRPIYIHLITIGWLSQLIMGVAYWMFPKFSKENPRGNEKLSWIIYALLNLGLLFRAIGEGFNTSGLGWLLVLSALCLFLTGWGFVINTWSRVKER
jgi:hypothetical protein